MGRKNKIKMHKAGSATNSPAKPPAMEGMKESLREIVGKVPAEAGQKLQFLYSELEKKSMELCVAKECIKQLQQEKPFAIIRGDGDSAQTSDPSLQKSIHQNQEQVLQLAEIHTAFNEEWKTIGEKIENISEDRVTLEGELNAAQEEIHVLKDEIKYLESSMKNTKESLEKGQQNSLEVENRLKGVVTTLENELKDANNKIDSLQSEIKNRESKYEKVSADLCFEKDIRAKRDSELIEAKEQADSNLEKALKEVSLIQRQIMELAFSVGKRSSENLDKFATAEEWEKHLLETGEVRVIDNGVLLIKNEFDSVKKHFSQLLEKNGTLKRQLESSDNDLKQQRQKCDEYYKLIEDLEKQNKEIQQSNAARIAESRQEYDLMKQSLEKQTSLHELARKQQEEKFLKVKCELDSIKAEFGSEDAIDVLDAFRQLKDEYEKVQLNNTAISESNSAVESEFESVKSQLSEKLMEFETVKLELQKIQEQKSEIDSKMATMEEELSSAKSMLKKMRKEKDSSTKKLKKKLDEVNAEKDLLAEQKKDVEEKLNEVSSNLISEESFRSLTEKSESYRIKNEEMQSEVQRLKEEVHQEIEKRVEQLSKFLVEKEDEIQDLNRTIIAQQSKIEIHIKDSTEKTKSVQRLESRILELQRSTESIQKRYEEESSATLQQLESCESELEAQQDLNARLTTATEEIRLKNTAEVANLTGEIAQLKGTIEQFTEKMNEMRNSQAQLAESMETELKLANSEKQKALDELASCKQSLAVEVEKSTNLEQELARVEALEKKKTEVLVSLTEEEKIQIREEKEKALLQLEAAQKALKDQKMEAKKHFDNDVRKLKKVIKAVEEQKNQALEEVSQVTLKLEETQQQSFDTKKFIEEEEKKHRKIVEELEELQKAIINCRVENERKLADEVALSESHRNQIMRQDIIIDRMSVNMKNVEDALVEMATEMERKDAEHEAALSIEKKQLQTLEKALEDNLEQVEESVNRQLLLEQNERKIEELREEYETALKEIATRLEQKEEELKKQRTETEQKSNLDSELEELKKVISEKNAIIDNIKKEMTDLESEKSELESEIENVSKQLAESPKKINQLENRLGVIQSAAQAQNKRLEEDLLKSNDAFVIVSKKNAEFEDMIGKKSGQIDELSAVNNQLRSELNAAKENKTSVDHLKIEVDQLRQQNRVLDEENKQERAGLVDELIATKDKVGEYEKVMAKQRVELDQVYLMEQELRNANEKINMLSTCSSSSAQEADNIDEMFPNVDPAVRQFIRLMAFNRNFAYGMAGIFAYAALIHLYILL